jgi:hypothetical protein
MQTKDYAGIRRTRKSLTALLTIVAVLVAGEAALAATYYVDYSGGHDANAGTSKAAPFKRCPGDKAATGKAASTTLVGGDTVYFKGGVSYMGQINLRSGLPGKPITYDGNLPRTWGSSPAVINNRNSTALLCGFRAPSFVRHVVLRGFIITEIGGLAVLPPANGCRTPVKKAPAGCGVDLEAGSSNVVVAKCSFREIGEWRNVDPLDDSAIAGTGIKIQNARNVVVDGCEFTRMSVGVSIKAKNRGRTEGVEVRNSDFHNYLRWCVDVAPRSGDGVVLSDIRIHHNLFHDYAEYDTGNWKGCGEKPHTDGIFLRTATMSNSVWRNIRIYGNEFYNSTSVGGGTACIYISGGPSAHIYNNTFVNTLHGRTIGVMYNAPRGTSPQEVLIDNNTFYNNCSAISLRDGRYRTVRIRNNIFADVRTQNSSVCINIEDTVSDPVQLDYNVYSLPYPRQYVMMRAGTLKNLATLRNTHRWELGTVFGPNVNPGFVDTRYGLGTSCKLNNLRLQANSVCTAALSLSSSFKDDKDVKTRVSPWTMGAYRKL